MWYLVTEEAARQMAARKQRMKKEPEVKLTLSRAEAMAPLLVRCMTPVNDKVRA